MEGTGVQMWLELQSVGALQNLPLPPGLQAEGPWLADCNVSALAGWEAVREQRLIPEGLAAGF